MVARIYIAMVATLLKEIFGNAKSILHNTFNSGLWLSSLEERSIPDTWSFLYNGMVTTEDDKNFGIGYELSTDLVCEISQGFIPRGDIIIPEENILLIFSYNPELSISEIGAIDLVRKEYTIYINDKDWEKKLAFGVNKLLKPKIFVKGDCREHFVLFNSCKTYFVFNTAKSKCATTYDDLLLLPCDSGPVLKLDEVKGGGLDLVGGTYYAAARFTDVDSNYSNFFWVSHPLVLHTRNNRVGEVSENSIKIEMFVPLSKHFEYIEIAIIRNIGGTIDAKLLPPYPYTRTRQTYDLTAEAQFSNIPITVDDIRAKDLEYVRGNDFDIVNGHALLYNTYGEPNYDILKYSTAVKVSWVAKLAPIKLAERFRSIARDEVYSVALKDYGVMGNIVDMVMLQEEKQMPMIAKKYRLLIQIIVQSAS